MQVRSTPASQFGVTPPGNGSAEVGVDACGCGAVHLVVRVRVSHSGAHVGVALVAPERKGRSPRRRSRAWRCVGGRAAGRARGQRRRARVRASVDGRSRGSASSRGLSRMPGRSSGRSRGGARHRHAGIDGEAAVASDGDAGASGTPRADAPSKGQIAAESTLIPADGRCERGVHCSESAFRGGIRARRRRSRGSLALGCGRVRQRERLQADRLRRLWPVGSSSEGGDLGAPSSAAVLRSRARCSAPETANR